MDYITNRKENYETTYVEPWKDYVTEKTDKLRA